MKPSKAEIAAGLEHWRQLYGHPKNKTRAGQGNGSQESQTEKACCDLNATTSDHACASSFPHPVLDDSYDVEVKLYEPVIAFRKAGRDLLPLRVQKGDAQDFGVHYFVCSPSGIPIFDAQDEFSAVLVRDAVTRVIECAGESA